MGENSKIEWTKHSFNPWIGCKKISEGCKNCYALRDSSKNDLAIFWEIDDRQKMKESYWRKPLKWNDKVKPGERDFVFCGSMCDICDPLGMKKFRYLINNLFELIKQTPNLFWVLLTKRPERFKKTLPKDWGEGYDNVMLMTTCENQKRTNERLPELLDNKSKYYGVSAEPLLEDIDFGEYLKYLNWVIVGGESGEKSRPLHPSSVYYIKDQCEEYSTPFFFKQWGECLHESQLILDVHTPVDKHWKKYSFGNNELGYYMGKENSGCLLDGKEYNQLPVLS